MADVFFFADPDLVEPQADDSIDATFGHESAFGPVLDSESSRFRVTSLHRGLAGGNPPAYAVCAGRVRLQRDPTATTLSLVLAPDDNLLPGVPLLYFVYRGIRLDSLVDTSGKLIRNDLTARPLDDNDPENDSLESLGLAFRRATDSAKNTDGTPLHLDLVREDTEPIDSLFFETSDLKPIPVEAGAHLGSLDGAGFGFEVLLRSPWEPPTLDLLRRHAPAVGNTIDLPNDTDPHREVRRRAARERVYGYLDPCAFYGMCAAKGSGHRILYRTSEGDSKNPLPNPQKVYDRLLRLFHNRNRIYIDLRNDNDLSYNYYDTYGTRVLLETNSSILENRASENAEIKGPSEAYTTHDWPLKIIPGTRVQISTGRAKAGIRMAMHMGESLAATSRRHLFLDSGFLYYNRHNRGGGRRKLFEPRTRRLIDVRPLHPSSIWTRDIVLGLPAVVDDTEVVPIAFYFKIRYLRQYERRVEAFPRYINRESPWDNLFSPDSVVPRWRNKNLVNWWLTGHTGYVSPELKGQQVYEGMVATGVAIDRDPRTRKPQRYTFYYIPTWLRREPKEYQVFSSPNPSGTSDEGTFFQSKESAAFFDSSRKLKLIKTSEYKTANSDPLDVELDAPPQDIESRRQFLSFIESSTREDVVANNISKESLNAWSFSYDEMATMLSIAENNFNRYLHPVYLQVLRRTYPRIAETATERAFQALDLRLVGYNDEGVYHSVDVPPTGVGAVQLASLDTDGMLFCTNEAASLEPLWVWWNYNSICTYKVSSRNTPPEDLEWEKDLFTRALSDLKRFHPEFYSRLERLQLLGTEIRLHSDPHTPLRRIYRIEVRFDPSMPAGRDKLAGDTEADHFKDLFKNTQQNVDSYRIGRFVGRLHTLESIAENPNRDFKYLNPSRYAIYNADRELSESEVAAKFLADYTREEIDAHVYDPEKFYAETLFDRHAKASTALSSPERITLEELRSIGFGVRDPNEPIRIRINRAEAKRRDDRYFLKKFSDGTDISGTNGESLFIPEPYSPEQTFVSCILAHELGHAEILILQPHIDEIWRQMEGFFDGEAAAGDITEKRPGASASGLRGLEALRLKAIIPYPAKIASELSDTQDAELKRRGFLPRTGNGHLRGSNSGSHSCGVERHVGERLYDVIISKLDYLRSIHAPSVELEVPAFSYRYCFLNYDDARLKS